MSEIPDPDDREQVEFPTCVECSFRIIGEPAFLGPYGWTHGKCLPEGTAV